MSTRSRRACALSTWSPARTAAAAAAAARPRRASAGMCHLQTGDIGRHGLAVLPHQVLEALILQILHVLRLPLTWDLSRLLSLTLSRLPHA